MLLEPLIWRLCTHFRFSWVGIGEAGGGCKTQEREPIGDIHAKRIGMDRFFKPAGSAPQKRVREEEAKAPSNAAAAAPINIRSICCWNANSLINRLKLNKPEVTDFLRSRKPDILFISEVRMPARGPSNCKRDDGQPRLRGHFSDDKKDREDADLVRNWARECGCGNSVRCATCRCVRCDVESRYVILLSLSDWRYAGVALMVRAACEQVVCARHKQT